MSRTLVAALAVAAWLVPAGAANAKAHNGRIVFGDRSSLVSIEPDGSDRQVLSDAWYRVGVAASPDGRRLVTAGNEGLDIIDAETGEVTGNVPLPSRTWIGSASWSPDGRELAFQSCDRTVFTDIEECVDYGVYRVHEDGSGLKRVAAGRSPSWSPDGRSLVFIHKVRRHDSEGNECEGIYVARRARSHPRRVLPRRATCALAAAQPFFAAGGKRVLFTKRDGRDGLWSVRLDGTGARRLVRAPHASAVSAARLSPDGRRIVYAARGIYVTGAHRGGRGRRISRTRPNALAWLPVASG
jgi:Tol biopolymer transport system component